MRVYYAGKRSNTTVMVAPAADPRATKHGIDSDWLGEDGAPRTITVNFVDGAAEVPDAMGRYLIKTGMAKRTRLWIPPGFSHRAA